MSTTTDQTVEFVSLAYGDVHCLNFTVQMRDLDQLTDCLDAVGSYNEFDAEKVAAVLTEFWPQIERVDFGREFSPVLYVTVPFWTHQANGYVRPDNATGCMGEPIPEVQRAELAEHFLEAMRRDALADEADHHVRYDEKVYQLRAWWD